MRELGGPVQPRPSDAWVMPTRASAGLSAPPVGATSGAPAGGALSWGALTFPTSYGASPPVIGPASGRSTGTKVAIAVGSTVGGQTMQMEASNLPSGWAAPVATAYGTGTSIRAVVAGGLHYIPDNHQTDFLNGVMSSAGDRGWSVTDSPAGPLGGKMKCFETTQGPTTTCAFADDGAWGVISVPGTGPAAHDQVLAVRAAVEHHP